MSESGPVSFTTRFLNIALSLPVVIVLGVGAIILWIQVFLTASNIMGDDSHSWPFISGQVKKIIGTTTVGIFILLLTSIIYFLQDQTKSVYVIFILLTISIIMAYSAIAAAAAPV